MDERIISAINDYIYDYLFEPGRNGRDMNFKNEVMEDGQRKKFENVFRSNQIGRRLKLLKTLPVKRMNILA